MGSPTPSVSTMTSLDDCIKERLVDQLMACLRKAAEQKSDSKSENISLDCCLKKMIQETYACGEAASPEAAEHALIRLFCILGMMHDQAQPEFYGFENQAQYKVVSKYLRDYLLRHAVLAISLAVAFPNAHPQFYLVRFQMKVLFFGNLAFNPTRKHFHPDDHSIGYCQKELLAQAPESPAGLNQEYRDYFNPEKLGSIYCDGEQVKSSIIAAYIGRLVGKFTPKKIWFLTYGGKQGLDGMRYATGVAEMCDMLSKAFSDCFADLQKKASERLSRECSDRDPLVTAFYRVVKSSSDKKPIDLLATFDGIFASS